MACSARAFFSFKLLEPKPQTKFYTLNTGDLLRPGFGSKPSCTDQKYNSYIFFFSIEEHIIIYPHLTGPRPAAVVQPYTLKPEP